LADRLPAQFSVPTSDAVNASFVVNCAHGPSNKPAFFIVHWHPFVHFE
jgi:hypothetical protein